MQASENYPRAPVERAMKVPEVNIAGDGEEDHVVAGRGCSAFSYPRVRAVYACRKHQASNMPLKMRGQAT